MSALESRGPSEGAQACTRPSFFRQAQCRVSHWMERHSAQTIAHDLERQVRLHPVGFAAGFFLLGFAGTRVLRSVAEHAVECGEGARDGVSRESGGGSQ